MELNEIEKYLGKNVKIISVNEKNRLPEFDNSKLIEIYSNDDENIAVFSGNLGLNIKHIKKIEILD